VTAPFVVTLRSRPEAIRIGDLGAKAATVRVEVPELWDVVRIETALSEPAHAIKSAALRAFEPDAKERDYVLKLRGFEVLNESMSLAELGAIDGSIFLLTNRRRRPVR